MGRSSPTRIFLGQFHDVMVLILLLAAAVSVALGSWHDAVPILIIVLLNALLGFAQEFRCEKTLEQMQKLAAPSALVFRDGAAVRVAASDVVVGDVLQIEAGERFPCDCLILSQSSLYCDESALTGENTPAAKCSYNGQQDKQSLNLPYMGYMGTSVLKGSAKCAVCAVGHDTQLGKISQMISDIEVEQTPLQKKLGELGRVLAAVCVAVCVLVFIAGVARGENAKDMFFTAVTAAIAAIPEGLPAAVTIALALAVRRMLKQNALVHKLHSVETLGCANVICTDKTGTLTKNQMTVDRLCVLSDNLSEYNCGGGVLTNTLGGERISVWDNMELCETLLSAALCSNVKEVRKKADVSGKSAKKGRRKRDIQRNRTRRTMHMHDYEGDPTEIALAQLCDLCGMGLKTVELKRVGEKPFDSESKYMSVDCRDKNGRLITFTKGAAEVVIPMCSHKLSNGAAVKLTDSERRMLAEKNDEYANGGLRVLALCESTDGYTVFLGFAALHDPLREGVAEAVAECRRAGISTIMITGDHKLTACAIARQAGILTPSKNVYTGYQLDKMSDEQLAEEISRTAVFARVTPAHKLRIVRACKKRGLVCAMTGDGVNDAPAVKEASIGVSMGISGTEVTKQAADMVLLDDNFSTLVAAVREGRTIYSNIRKFVRYLLACNIGEILTVLGAIIMGLPTALVPAQLLLINLVTDGLPAAALSAEPPEEGIMHRPPRRESDSFFSGGLMTKIVFRGVLIAISTLACFTSLLSSGAGTECARTCAALTLVFSQLIYVFECRSEDKTLFEISPKGSKYAVAAVISSLVCVWACMAVPKLSEIFSLKNPDTKCLAITAFYSLLVPLITGAEGKIKTFVKSKRTVSI